MHEIRFVSDEAMPPGHDFVLVQCGARDYVILYRESAITPKVLEDSWAAFRALAADPHPPLRSVS